MTAPATAGGEDERNAGLIAHNPELVDAEYCHGGVDGSRQTERMGLNATSRRQRIQRVDLDREVWGQYLAGSTVREIASAVGRSIGWVSGSLQRTRMSTQVAVEEVAQQRVIECARLERLFAEAYGIATNAELPEKVRLSAIDRAVRLSERKSRLLGLNTPERVNVGFDDVRAMTDPAVVADELRALIDAVSMPVEPIALGG